MTVDLVVNVGLVIFITSNLAILYMSNIGYILCHVFALSGFLLLRRDRPNWPRPISLAVAWLPIAGVLCVLNAFFLVVGALAPHLNGYGSWTDFAIGIGILVGSLLLFLYRHIVQERDLRWREEPPQVPDKDEIETWGIEAPVGTALVG
jgi:amino acid transporter